MFYSTMRIDDDYEFIMFGALNLSSLYLARLTRENIFYIKSVILKVDIWYITNATDPNPMFWYF